MVELTYLLWREKVEERLSVLEKQISTKWARIMLKRAERAEKERDALKEECGILKAKVEDLELKIKGYKDYKKLQEEYEM